MNPNNLQSAIHVFRRLLESRESDCDEVLQSLKGLSSILNSIVSVTASDALLTDLSPSNRCGYHSTSVGHKIVAKLYLDAESTFSHISTLLFVGFLYCVVGLQMICAVYMAVSSSQEAAEGAGVRFHLKQQQRS